MKRATYSLLLLALVLCGLAIAQETPSWPLAVRIHSYGEYQDAAWTHLPELGVEYLFLSVPEPGEVDATMEKLQAHGLKPLVMRGSAELSKSTFVEDIAPQLAICKKMGVKYMFLSAKRGDSSKEEAYARLRAAGDIARDHGVVIALETHPDLGTNGAVQIETMETVNHPNIRVNFDTANITYYNKDTSAVDELKKSIGYVGTVEFKDHSGGLETWDFPVLGKGTVDFPVIVDMLREHNYQGPITLEFEGTRGVELNEAETKQAIADCVAAARQLLEVERTSDGSAMLENEFFVFDNGMGRGKWTIEEQASTLAELGYDGIGYTGGTDLDERLAAFDKHKVKIFNIYIGCNFSVEPSYARELTEAIERLKGTDVTIWLTVQGQSDSDERAVRTVGNIADMAAASGLKVALYPHHGFYVADLDDALRIVRQVKRDNLGVTFNLCHELRAGNESRFDELLEEAAPHLLLVSINGADHEGDWDRLIQPLGQGEFDILPVLRKLQAIGYAGPIGLQCYQVKGDTLENLKHNIAEWHALRARLKEEIEGR